MTNPGAAQPKRSKLRIAVIVAAVLFLPSFFCFRCTVMGAYEIEGPSMTPAYCNGDRLMIARYAFGLFPPGGERSVLSWGTPELGDAVVLVSPADGTDTIKRVVGLPGDVIEWRGDVLHRNGRAIRRRALGHAAHEIDTQCFRETLGGRSWDTAIEVAAVPSDYAPVTVPAGEYYVVGDRRHRAMDSRFFGTVRADRFKGRVIGRYARGGDDPDPCLECPR